MTLPSLKLYATNVQADYPTCEPMTTKVRVGGVHIVKFEVDTAASHSILTCDTYNRLRNAPCGNIPELKTETRTLRLADGQRPTGF